MTIPMIVLAFGSVFAGGLFSIGDRFVHWLEPVTAVRARPLAAQRRRPSPGATVVAMLIGVGIAWLQYGRRPVPVVAPRGSLLTRAARRDLLQDDFNHVVLVTRRRAPHPLPGLRRPHPGRRRRSTARPPRSAASPAVLRRLQNGFARSYAVSMFGGAAVLDRRDPADEGGLSRCRFPLLTATAALPAVGAIATAAVPAAQAHRGQVARAARLAGHARAGRRSCWSASTRAAPATSSPNRTPGSRTSASGTNWAWTASRSR